MLRSLADRTKDEHAKTITGLYPLQGAEVEIKGAYLGWTPNISSATLKIVIKTHKSLFSSESEVEVIHAGLECGTSG